MASSKPSKQWKEFLEKFKGDSNAYSTATGNLLNNISLDASGIDPRFTKSYLEEQNMLNRAKISANNIADQQTRFAGYLSYLGQNANERLAEAFTPEEKPPRDRPRYETYIPKELDPDGTQEKQAEAELEGYEEAIEQSTQLPEPTLSPTESTNTDLVQFKPVKARYLNQGVTQLIHGFNPETSEGWAPSHLYDPSGKHSGKDGHTHVAFKTKEDFDRAVTRAKEAGYSFSTGRDNNPGSNHNKNHAHPDGKAIDYEWRYRKGHEKAGQPIPYTPEAEKLWHTTWRDILFADKDPFRN